MKSKVNYNLAFDELAEEDKNKLNKLFSEIKKIEKVENGKPFPIEDNNIKKRIAGICLDIIEKTPKNKIAIMKTAYIITGFFIRFNYNDELGDIIEIAGGLELPEEHVSEDVFELWEKMKNMFKEYLKKII